MGQTQSNESAADKESKELTPGQRAIGVSFNPSKDPFVDEIKQDYAAIWDKLDEKQKTAGQGDKGRRYAIAKTYLEDSKMRAVEAITWQY